MRSPVDGTASLERDVSVLACFTGCQALTSEDIAERLSLSLHAVEEAVGNLVNLDCLAAVSGAYLLVDESPTQTQGRPTRPLGEDIYVTEEEESTLDALRCRQISNVEVETTLGFPLPLTLLGGTEYMKEPKMPDHDDSTADEYIVYRRSQGGESPRYDPPSHEYRHIADGLRVLDCFSPLRPTLTTDEISDLLDLPDSEVIQHTTRLAQLGYLRAVTSSDKNAWTLSDVDDTR